VSRNNLLDDNVVLIMDFALEIQSNLHFSLLKGPPKVSVKFRDLLNQGNENYIT
jgi:hypothetical protein